MLGIQTVEVLRLFFLFLPEEKLLSCPISFIYFWQNVVMLMNDIVDWLIPDIPKDISLQIHKEKILLVELFMKEEQGKSYIIDSSTSTDGKENCSKHNNNSKVAPPRSRRHTNSTKSF